MGQTQQSCQQRLMYTLNTSGASFNTSDACLLCIVCVSFICNESNVVLTHELQEATRFNVTPNNQLTDASAVCFSKRIM